MIHVGHSCNVACPMPVLHISDPFVPSLAELAQHLDVLPKTLYVAFYGSNDAWRELLGILEQREIQVVEDRRQAEGMLHIGNGVALSTLVQTAAQPVFTLTSAGFQQHDAYLFLSRRYHYISQVKTAQVFGLLILSIPIYRRIGQQVRALLKSHQKAAYPIYMGKITQGKLGNFSEIDMFVVIGCAHRDLPDNREFYKPIISAFELQAGLRDEWDWTYSAEFDCAEEVKEGESEQSVAERFLGREFRGLNLEADGKITVEEGYTGIASRYRSEYRNTM